MKFKSEIHSPQNSSVRLQSIPEPKMQRISISRVALLLTIAILGASTFLSIQSLLNPLSLPWAKLEEPVPVTIDQLNPAQTIAQIKADLLEFQLLLGDKLITSSSDINIYPILNKDSKTIRQIRIYQVQGSSAFWEDEQKRKLRLIRQTDVEELEEEFVKAPFQKYLVNPPAIDPKNNTLPLTDLQPIYGNSPSQGIWFTAIGRKDSIVYGQVFAYMPAQLSLNLALTWTNPNGRLPDWQRFPTLKNPEPDLVIDQTQNSDPAFLVFRLEATPNSSYPFQFRHLNLHEAPAMPKIYSEALILASGGLWSPALAKLEQLKSNLQTKNEVWEPVIQEQYDLISYHAKITSEQAKKPNADYGITSLFLGMDGLWADALKNLQGADFTAKIVLEMLETNSPHLWLRVNTALEVAPTPEVVMWGSVIVLQRQGFPSAEKWLRSHWNFPKRDISEALVLLQRLDLSPLGIEPQQFVGTVRLVGNTLEDKWQITPPPLLTGQTWYEVNISAIRDRDVWRNTPFPALESRSRLIIWKALGLEANNSLSVDIANSTGNIETTDLIAQSIWVGNNGQIKLLATGSQELGNTLAGKPALVKGGNLFVESRGAFIVFEALDREVGDRIVNTIYSELLTIGNISLSDTEFREKLSRWTLEKVNLQGKDSQDLLLRIDRDKIDLGDRSYPIVFIFSKTGDLLFTDMQSNSPQRWVTLLPGSNPQKILVESNGNYDSLSLTP